MLSIFLLWCVWSGCDPKPISTEEGLASYYADHFHDQLTANGELYDSTKFTAAHRDLPFGQVVRVMRRDNGKSVKVRINDRGPFNYNRIIDLSKIAAQELGMIEEGVVPVVLEVLAEVNP